MIFDRQKLIQWMVKNISGTFKSNISKYYCCQELNIYTVYRPTV